jgi:thymidylate synthase ThyX
MQRQVYALVNLPPEVQAFGLARFSRSAQSCRESVRELSAADAAKRLEKFYFQYGHHSIADLGHIALAVENVSQIVADELEYPVKPWDGQERSTRYQDFTENPVFVPASLSSRSLEKWEKSLRLLRELYVEVREGMQAYYHEHFSPPPGIEKKQAKRIIFSRSLDVARYCLPLATLTSVGQVTSIRTLEEQISRLRVSEFAEVREVAEEITRALRYPAFNLPQEKLLSLHAEDLKKALSAFERAFLRMWVRKQMAETVWSFWRKALLKLVLPDVVVAPTLARHTAPAEFWRRARKKAIYYARKLLPLPATVEGVEEPEVDVVWLEADFLRQLAAAILYWGAEGQTFRCVWETVKKLPLKQCKQIADEIEALRGEFDEWLPVQRVGYHCAVEFRLDIGADRDLKRHRRCVQIPQRFNVNPGFVVPAPLRALPALRRKFQEVMGAVQSHIRALAVQDEEVAIYLMPFAQLRPRLFLMDLAELAYIAELRSRPQGHFAYREAVGEMMRKVLAREPNLRSLFRLHDIREEEDFWVR